jgi:hypothetical protein
MKGIKNIFSRKIPLWKALALFAVIALLVVAAGMNFSRSPVFSRLLGSQPVAASNVALVFGPEPSLSNANFFSEVKTSFIDQKADFIEVDLSAMVLRVYLKGEVVKEVKVLAKGKEGSWWETPAGLYKIESKEPSHFSSLGKVDMPWSMDFQGNFFIHGWPNYPDGTPVSGSYSGGCIRLSNDDAKAVYDLAYKDMPVLVFEKAFSSDNFQYAGRGPQISASSYLAADLKNNYVFLDKNTKDPVRIGNLTQIFTALISAEYINLDKDISYEGQSVTAVNVLYPLMLESSNDAAQTLAQGVGKNYFVRLMNSKAQALGMSSTTLVDVAGENAGNVSTAEDMFNLAKYIYNNRSFVWKISTGNLTSSAYGSPVFANLENKNTIPDISMEFVGGKFDPTPGSQAFIGVYNLMVHGEVRPIVISVFGSEAAKADAATIAAYIQANFR